MKIVIDIPEEYIKHFEADRFSESLHYLREDATRCEGMSGGYEAELCNMLITAFRQAKELRIPSRGLVSLKDVYWMLGDYFIPRFNIHHVVYEDIDTALRDIPIAIEAEEGND